MTGMLELVDAIKGNKTYTVRTANTVRGVFSAVRNATDHEMILVTVDPKLNEFVYRRGDMMGVRYGDIRIYTNAKGRMVGIAGYTKFLQQLPVDASGTFYLASIESLQRRTDPILDQMDGIPFAMGILGQRNGTVAIFAGGVEEWDGNTPFATGIGASESSVIYLAEELYVQGKDVTVFCPVSSYRRIGGVLYAPINEFVKFQTKWDLLISSRNTEVLKMRRATKQVLWMHDVAEVYDYRNLECDEFVCLSQWQRQRAEELGYPKHKLVVRPNPMIQSIQFNKYPKEKVQGRTVWMSQPERGLNYLYELAQGMPVGDLYVAYGFYNYLTYTDSVENFQKAYKMKHRLRKMNAKIVGRIPTQEMRELLDTVETLYYISDFPETFCVSVLEAAMSNVNIFVNDNVGAVAETLETYVSYDSFTSVPGVNRDIWADTILNSLFKPDADAKDLTKIPTADKVVHLWL
jgi:glycosyltransferase involved in cell wall biosynthesis